MQKYTNQRGVYALKMDQYSIKTLLCVVGNEFGSIQITMYNNIVIARTITYQNKNNVQYKTSITFVLYMYWPQIIHRSQYIQVSEYMDIACYFYLQFGWINLQLEKHFICKFNLCTVTHRKDTGTNIIDVPV